MLLNKQWIAEEIKWEIFKNLENNDKENMVTKNQWNAEKAALRWKITAIQSHLKKQGKFPTSNLTSYLKQLEKEEQTEPQVSRRKEIIQIRNKWNRNKTIAKFNRTKSRLFKNINKIGKCLAKLIKEKRRGLKSIKLEIKMKSYNWHHSNTNNHKRWV